MKGVKMEREVVDREVADREEQNSPKNEVFQTTGALALTKQKAKIHSTKVISFDPSLVNARFGVLEKLAHPILSKIPSLS